jgi:hypothetical protein
MNIFIKLSIINVQQDIKISKGNHHLFIIDALKGCPVGD